MMKRHELSIRWEAEDANVVSQLSHLLSDMEEFCKYFECYLKTMDDGEKRFDFRGLTIADFKKFGGYYVELDLSFGRFINCNLDRPSFAYSHLNHVKFSNCILSNGGFQDSSFTDACFENTTIDNFIMCGNTYTRCRFKNVELRDVNLAQTDLSSCDFDNVKGERVSLRHARLPMSQKQFDWWRHTPESHIFWV